MLQKELLVIGKHLGMDRENSEGLSIKMGDPYCTGASVLSDLLQPTGDVSLRTFSHTKERLKRTVGSSWSTIFPQNK